MSSSDDAAAAASHDTRDARFMQSALDQARLGGWATHPNPMVGAVIVRDDAIIARGHHRAVGLEHAEVAALGALSDPALARGAEMFVTLEPCDHYAHTPPCSLAVLEAGIRRVVVGMVDPDPRVSGAGIQRLRDAGVEVVVGVLEDACRDLNAPFLKRVTRTLPWITLKLAQSLDGRIATRTGHSQWITGPDSRREVHRMRARHDAVLVGTGTLLADDPQLTVRLDDDDFSVDDPHAQPLRVVLDRQLRAPHARAVFDTTAARTVLVTSTDRVADARGRYTVVSPDLEILGVGEDAHGQLDLVAMLTALVRDHQITTVLCEGGGELAASLLAGPGLVDELVTFVAPRVIGGREAPGPIGGTGAETMAEALDFDIRAIDRVGADVRIVSRPRRPLHPGS